MKNNKDPKIVNLVLTGIRLHAADPRKPLSPIRAMEKSLRNKKPGKWIKKILPGAGENGKPLFSVFDGYEIALLSAKLKAEGKKLQITCPKNGIKIYADKDILEHEASKRRKAFDKARKLKYN